MADQCFDGEPKKIIIKTRTKVVHKRFFVRHRKTYVLINIEYKFFGKVTSVNETNKISFSFINRYKIQVTFVNHKVLNNYG